MNEFLFRPTDSSSGTVAIKLDAEKNELKGSTYFTKNSSSSADYGTIIYDNNGVDKTSRQLGINKSGIYTKFIPANNTTEIDPDYLVPSSKIISKQSIPVKLTANSYVSPYTHLGNVKVDSYGIPISYGASASGGVPVPCYYNASNSTFYVVAMGTSATISACFI